MNNLEMEYEQRLMAPKLSSLEYRRARGDMIETFKIIHGYYDHRLFVPCLSCINLLELEDTISNYISHKKIIQDC